MRKSPMLIAVMLAPLILAPREASAMTVSEAISECDRIGGHWQFSGLSATCLHCYSDARNSVVRPICTFIWCDLAGCQESDFIKRPRKPPLLRYFRK
jgi:hypothetical protein